MPTGTRNTGDISARKYDMQDTISLLDAKRYPLLAILSNAGKDPASGKGKAFKKVTVSDPEFKWFEDTFGSREATVAAVQTIDPDAGGETFDVTAGQGARFAVGDTIHIVDQKWTFQVTAVSTDTITISAEIGGATGGATDISADTVWIVGNANAEGAGIREIKGTTPTEKVGYTQIFRTPFGITNTSKATKGLIKENDLDYQRRKKAIEHAVDIERAFFFSKKYKVTSGSDITRNSMGIVDEITTYATASVDTEAEFETWLESVFAHGGTEKYLYASSSVISLINGFASGKLQTVRADQTYGVTILKYVSAHGTLNIIKHDLLTGSVYGNYGIALDMEAVEYATLEGRDTKLLTDRQPAGYDGVVEEYLSEVGLKFSEETRHAVMSTSTL
ncbi:DUF5309 family protein [Candidatus Babeliales bacterium]|nr:DUF5309 family protein [Candidatus Babeliales bacterium]